MVLQASNLSSVEPTKRPPYMDINQRAPYDPKKNVTHTAPPSTRFHHEPTQLHQQHSDQGTPASINEPYSFDSPNAVPWTHKAITVTATPQKSAALVGVAT